MTAEPTRSATLVLSEYALGLETSQFPPPAVQMAKAVLTDTVGVLLASSRGRPVRTAIKTFPVPSHGRCTVIGHGHGAAPEQAAFVNGIGGHSIELDDTHGPSRNHPAAQIVPAALAAAEEVGHCTGIDLLAAITVAYDVQARISKAMGPKRPYERGFHSMSICGTIGAAVAAGRLLGLSVDQMRSCIALAASQSSGLTTFQDDDSHMLKAFHSGVAARNGLYAALLARDGFEGAPDALAGRHNVLVPFGGPGPDLAQLSDALGDRFEICYTSIKRHACCGQIHGCVDALLALQRAHGFGSRDITRIDARVAHSAVPIVDQNPLWTHNLQHVLAVAAQEGLITPEHFEDTWTNGPDTAELATRVFLGGSDELQTRFPAQKGGIVTVTTAKGTWTKEMPEPLGAPSLPLSEAEIQAKFTTLVVPVLGAASAQTLCDMLSRFDERGANTELLVPLLV